MSSPPLRLGVVLAMSNETLIERCMRMVEDNAIAECRALLYFSIDPVTKLQGLPFELVAVRDAPPDFSTNGSMFRSLLNGSLDSVMTNFVITSERMSAGIAYTNPTGRAEFGMLFRRFEHGDASMLNTRILTERLSWEYLILVCTCMTALFVVFVLATRRHSTALDAAWSYVREMTPGANTNSFALHSGVAYRCIVTSCCLLTIVYEVYWQAVLAQSLMLERGSNLDELPYDVIARVSSNQHLICNLKGAQYHLLMNADDRFSREFRRATGDDGPKMVETTADILESVTSNGDVFMATWAELLGIVAAMSDEECGRVQLIRQPMDVPLWHGLVLSPALSEERLDEIKSITLQRTNHDDSARDALPLSPHCRASLFPTAVTAMAYNDLALSTMGGAFCAWAGMAFVATLVFAVEMRVDRLGVDDDEDATSTETDTFSLEDMLDERDVFTFRVDNERQRAHLFDVFRRAQAQIAALR